MEGLILGRYKRRSDNKKQPGLRKHTKKKKKSPLEVTTELPWSLLYVQPLPYIAWADSETKLFQWCAGLCPTKTNMKLSYINLVAKLGPDIKLGI